MCIFYGIYCTCPSSLICGLVCQKQVSRARTSNYIPQILWDVITCPCPWYLLLAHKSSMSCWWVRFYDTMHLGCIGSLVDKDHYDTWATTYLNGNSHIKTLAKDQMDHNHTAMKVLDTKVISTLDWYMDNTVYSTVFLYINDYENSKWNHDCIFVICHCISVYIYIKY